MNIINKTVLSELESHISHEKFLRNIQTFVDYMPGQLVELGDSLHSGDMKAVVEKAHTLKGTCGQFGAMRMQELFKTIETCAEEGGLRDVQMIVRSLPYEFQLVRELITLTYMQSGHSVTAV